MKVLLTVTPSIYKNVVHSLTRGKPQGLSYYVWPRESFFDQISRLSTHENIKTKAHVAMKAHGLKGLYSETAKKISRNPKIPKNCKKSVRDEVRFNKNADLQYLF